MDFRVLGPLEVWRGGVQIALGKPRERALLALLLLHANEIVPCDELIERLWGTEPPPTAKAALHNAVSALRKALGTDAIQTVAPGYRIRVTSDELDALRFQARVAEARGAEAAVRVERLGKALAEWRGQPLSDYAFAESEIVQLEELHLLALEERVDAELELGRASELVPELEGLVGTYPLRERFWAQLMLSLYRAGRPAEALAAYRDAHTTFVDELGLEPGATLRELQRAILVQDPALFELHGGPDLIERAAPFLPTTELGRAAALYDYGLALWRTGERARAKSALLECEDRAEAVGDHALGRRARVLRAEHATQAGEISAAEFEQIAHQVLEAARADNDLVGLADALKAHGQALRDVGFPDRAVACHREGIEVALKAGDQWREGFARGMLGVALMLGTTPVEAAVRECERQLAALDWGAPGPIGLWIGLGVLQTQSGREEEGRGHLERAAEALRAVRAASTLSGVELFSAWAAAIAGDRAGAVAHARIAVELVQSLGDAGSWGTVAALLALLEAQSGRTEDAERLIAFVRTIPNADGPLAAIWTRRAEADVARSYGDDMRAADLSREACLRAGATEFLTLYAETLEGAGELDAALAAFRRKGDIVGSARVEERIAATH